MTDQSGTQQALLSFSKMVNEVEIIKADYMTEENITAKLKAEKSLDHYFKFKSNGDYEFLLCENCEGPMLGHKTATCRHTEGYEEKTITKFKNWLERERQADRQTDIQTHRHFRFQGPT